MLAEQSAIDRAYDPALTIPNAAELLKRLADASSRARKGGVAPMRLRYGTHPADIMDLYAPTTPGLAPVHLFIHGGFWRAFTAADYAFVGPPFVKYGLVAAVLDYPLCPAADIAEIVDHCRAAVVQLCRRAHEFGGDRDRITISGHSAGGHIAAMLAATDWTRFDIPGDVIKVAIPISGIFELEPLSHSWLQPILSITPAIAAEQSPIRQARYFAKRTLVCVGALETSAFHAQADAYAARLRSAGHPIERLELANRNHIDILFDFLDGGPLLDAITAEAKLRPVGPMPKRHG